MKRSTVRTGCFLIIVLVAAMAFSGCERAVESFSVDAYEEIDASSGSPGAFRLAASIPLKERPGVKPAEEGRLIVAEEGTATPWYELRYSAADLDPTEWANALLRLNYRSGGPLVLEMKTEEGGIRSAVLPAADENTLDVRIPLSGFPVRTFRFSAEQASGSGPKTTADFRIVSLQLIRNGPADGPVISLSAPSGGENEVPRFSQLGFAVEYSYHPRMVQAGLEDAEKNVVLEVRGDTQKVPLRLFPREGTHTVYLYTGDLPFNPLSISLESSVPDFRIEKIVTRPVSLLVEKTPDPIPADMGTILRYDTDAWRRSDYELFSWNLFPNILIFDFRDYQLQSAFLKRLSFFVEKKGSTGRLLTNSLIGPLHGWNAHDYRAADLARFFQQAEEESFRLNDEEYLLRDILLEHGIIRRSGGEYRTGDGGILSISRESGDRLRYVFITHEGYHGLYFASEEYRREVKSVWDDLSGDEQEFWKIFLDWKLYEVRDTDLVINEFQAYLMQQHLSYVD
ncbi:MAG: hypothetical protein SVR04_06605, partial [Spirochaetota bacterium]|nr:hypothetical protein [Spirochaetota bacterium]